MIHGQAAILDLIRLFQNRHVSLYHACQLKDFKSYLELGGIPSRALLERRQLPFTAFRSDQADRNTGTWDKVFFNLSDFGRHFHRGSSWTPNVYGPILVRLDPDCIENATDVAICLRSAGRPGFNRANEALASVTQVNQIFAHPANDVRSTFLKQGDALRREFASKPNIIVTGSPEISCTVLSQIIPVDYFTRIIVDPVVVEHQDLVQVVKEVAGEFHGQLAEIVVRHPVGTPFRDLVAAVRIGVSSVEQILAGNFSPPLKQWAQKCKNNDLGWQFASFSEYLRLGTIEELEEIEFAQDDASYSS